MTLKEIVERLKLEVCCGEDRLDREVTGGYVGDLLSDVMANSKAGQVWVTMQVHVNIVAVAVLKELSAIILVHNRRPAEDTVRKAVEEHITVLSSRWPAFETVAMLSELGIGRREEC